MNKYTNKKLKKFETGSIVSNWLSKISEKVKLQKIFQVEVIEH